MVQTRETLLAEFNDEGCRNAAAQLLDVAEAAGATYGWGANGVSIRVECSRWQDPISVAWLYPPFKRGFRGTRDFSFGVDQGKGTVYDSTTGDIELLAVLRHWRRRFRDVSTDRLDGGITGYVFACHAAMGNIDLLADRLVEVIEELKAL